MVIPKVPQELHVLDAALNPQHVLCQLKLGETDLESHNGSKQLNTALGEIILFVLDRKSNNKAEGEFFTFHVDRILSLEANLTPNLGLVELPRPSLFDHHQEDLQEVGVGSFVTDLVFKHSKLGTRTSGIPKTFAS